MRQVVSQHDCLDRRKQPLQADLIEFSTTGCLTTLLAFGELFEKQVVSGQLFDFGLKLIQVNAQLFEFSQRLRLREFLAMIQKVVSQLLL